MSESKVSWRNIIVFAGAYVATIIGSGFATGQEIMQFFTFYGLTGIFGCIVTLVVFSFTGMECLSRGRVVQIDETVKIFSFYCGKYFGKFLEYFVPLFLFGVYVIMISGAGATLEEYYNLNPYVGRVLMSLAAFASVIFGLKGMMNVVGNVGPIIIIFAVTVGLVSLVQNYDQLADSIQTLSTLELAKPAPNGFIAGLLYPAYNMLVVVGLLSGMGRMANNKKECLYGGFLGGFLLFLAALVMHLAMLSQIQAVSSLSIPSLFLASQISPLMAKAFSVILMLGIYTTAAPLLWQTVNRFVADKHPRFKITTVAITVIGFICGLLPFDRLIGIIYPFTGYIGIIVFVLMVIKVVRIKVSK
ncbi:hypothetical protein ACLGL1_05185 [Peptococcus simiae]|uniref:YkvI family membrane protein n=1 Tax=Peptococcus simiae TaxID=1643805 RepID=UPI00397ED08E